MAYLVQLSRPEEVEQWDPDAGLFLPGQATFSYPVDVWGYSEVGTVDAAGPGTSTGVSVGDVVWGLWGHRSHAVLPAGRLADQPPHDLLQVVLDFGEDAA